jgi:hypothetical protein
MEDDVFAALIILGLLCTLEMYKMSERFERKWQAPSFNSQMADLQTLKIGESSIQLPTRAAAVPSGPTFTTARGATQAPGKAGALLDYAPPPDSTPVVDESPPDAPPVDQVPAPPRPLASALTASPKKGFVAGVGDPTCTAKIVALNCGWFYTWGPTAPSPAPNLPFIPMFWNVSKTKNPQGVLSSLTLNEAPGPNDVLLGYNEPDGTNTQAQGNMQVSDAVAFWRNLAATGRILVAPVMYGSMIKGPSKNNTEQPSGVSGPVSINVANSGQPPNKVTLDPSIWIDNFLIQLSQTASPVFPSIMAIHWYGPPRAESFLNYVDSVWAKYHMPIWVTEYSCADWSATCCPNVHVAGFDWSYPTTANIGTNGTAQFMTQTVAGMNQRSYVQRYSWKERFLLAAPGPTVASPDYPMVGQPDSVMSQSNPDFMNQSALFASYQHFPTVLPPLTPLGNLYASL